MGVSKSVSELVCFVERLTSVPTKIICCLEVCIDGQEAKRCTTGLNGWDKFWIFLEQISPVHAGKVKENGGFRGGIRMVSWILASFLLLCSWLQLCVMGWIVKNDLHCNKYITYTLDDQKIWQPEKNYFSQEDDSKLCS